MTKLLKMHREFICARLIEATFRERLLRLKQRENALAIKLMRGEYGEDVFTRLAALPIEWIATAKTARFKSRHSNYARIDFLEYTVVPYPAAIGRVIEDPTNLWLDEYDSFSQDEEALREELALLRSQVRSTLAAFTTVEKLAVDWPEAYVHLPTEMITPIGTVPALRVKDINTRIDAAREAA